MPDKRSPKFDVLAIALLALTTFLGVALFTYNVNDPPSDIVYPPSETVENACGRSGAFAAHYLFQALGIGAYYAVGSMAVLTVFLLLRREISQPVLRAVGWVASLVAITTLAALALENVTPGPVIGAGGYLGALCEGVLENNFATIGAYILGTTVLVAGLLLCTDYFLVMLGAGATVATAKSLLRAGQLGQAAGRAAISQNNASKKTAVAPDVTEEDDEEYEDDEYEYEYEYEDDEEEDDEADELDDNEIAIRTPEDIAAESDANEEAGEDVEVTPAPQPPKRVKDRIKSVLGIKTPADRKRQERDAVIEELDAAVLPDVADYEFPPLDLLLESDETCYEEHKREVRRKAKILEKTFANFGFNVKVVQIETGPVIAQYEVELEAGLRLSRITGLADDLAIALRVPSVRIVAPIPGKNTVGIEVPNDTRQLVRLREVIEESNGRSKAFKIPIYLGKDVSGNPMVVDLAAMPHLLIAGRTGTGKSVCLNSIIVSMLMGRGPDEVRMLMIDPKMVELSPYKTLPHLMHPVVTDMRKAEAILSWAVDKMEERYSLLANAGVRHVSIYNQLGEDELRDRLKPEDEEAWEAIPKHLPFIVIVADEIADLMMTAGKDVEQHIIRLAQKSRAVGIHLILATQKPTVDVITGLIKSNLPARIAFQVASRTDSRVVLDEMGADKLLGNGDMLFLSPGTSTLLRGQGTYLSDDEISRVVDFVGTDSPDFVNELVQLKAKDDESADGPSFKQRDELYESAVDVIVREGRGSVSLLQRMLGIGYGRAARLVDYMAEDGIVGEYNGSQAREVLISVADWEAMNGEEPSPDPPDPPSPPRPKRSNKISPEESETLPGPHTTHSSIPTVGSGVASAMLGVGDALAPWEEEDEAEEEDSLDDDGDDVLEDDEEWEYEDDDASGEDEDEYEEEDEGEENDDEWEYEDEEEDEDDEYEYVYEDEDDEANDEEDELEDDEYEDEDGDDDAWEEDDEAA